MKHSIFSDCIVPVCAAVITVAAMGVACHDTPPALSPKALDCQFHVLDTYLGGDQALVDQVKAVTQGKPQLEEFVGILVELYRSDAQIIDAGEAFLACLPVKAPVPDAGDKVL